MEKEMQQMASALLSNCFKVDLLGIMVRKEAGRQFSLDQLPVPQEVNEGSRDFVLGLPDECAPFLCHLSPMDQILLHSVEFPLSLMVDKQTGSQSLYYCAVDLGTRGFGWALVSSIGVTRLASTATV